jgi:hypothetical protein
VSIDKLLRRVGTIKNANQWESFVATLGGINAGHRANASIRVQPTTVCRRRDGVTRGSKRAASERPAMGTKRANKRPRNLANAISHNQPNAKSHGSVHKRYLACLTSVVHRVAFLTEKICPWPKCFLFRLIN